MKEVEEAEGEEMMMRGGEEEQSSREDEAEAGEISPCRRLTI